MATLAGPDRRMPSTEGPEPGSGWGEHPRPGAPGTRQGRAEPVRRQRGYF